jgi:hypothetical protein
MGLLAQVRRRSTLGLAWRALQARGLVTSSALLEPAPKPVPLSKLKDSFLDGTSSTYLEELEERYRANPASVDKTWASFFNSMGKTAGWGSLQLADHIDSSSAPLDTYSPLSSF